MSRFLNSKYQSMEPYTPGEQPRDRKYIKLNTNECPYAPSPKVLDAVTREETSLLRLYPDPEAKDLITALAKYYQVSEKQVMVGNGSDEILAFCYMAFCEDGICYPSISYGFYPVFAETFGVRGTAIPLKEDFTIDINDYKNVGKSIVIANPNAPTGMSLSLAQIEEILASNPDHAVMIDEAYVDFGGESALPLLKKYNNLVVIQTFSKSRSLAGGRLGFAIASEEMIADLNKIKFSFNPYNINRLTLLAGIAAVEDVEYFKSCTARIAATREKTTQALQALGFTVLPSKTNFIFANPNEISGTEYFTALREKGVLVRHWQKAPIADFVRITIGSEEEMETFVEITKEILADEKK